MNTAILENIVIAGSEEFNNNKVSIIQSDSSEFRYISVQDVAKLHGLESKYVNRLIGRNKCRFSGQELIDFLSATESPREFALENGLITSNNQKHAYILSERGYIKLVAMLDNGNEKKWEVLELLLHNYFAMRDIATSQAAYIKVLEQRNNALEEIERLNAICEIPRTQLKKDIRVFMNTATKDHVFTSTPRIEVYNAYRESRKHRAAQPPRSLFDDIVSELGYVGHGAHWIDIVLR